MKTRVDINDRLAYFASDVQNRVIKTKEARTLQKVASHHKIKESEIRELIAQSEGKCFYCARLLSGSYTLDHFIPISKGGARDKQNVRISCQPCNSRKGNRLPTDRLMSELRSMAAYGTIRPTLRP